MPRSGRAPRRKPVQRNQSANELPDVASPPIPQKSSLEQGDYIAPDHPQPQRFLPPYPTPPIHRQPIASQQAALSFNQIDVRSSSPPYTLPQPSPSFRFPSVPQVSSASTSREDLERPHPSLYAEPLQYNHPVPLYLHKTLQYGREEPSPDQTLPHPSRAQEYGRDGNSFRVTSFMPPRLEHSSMNHPTLASRRETGITSATEPTESVLVNRAQPNLTTKPILPCQSPSGFTQSELRTSC